MTRFWEFGSRYQRNQRSHPRAEKGKLFREWKLHRFDGLFIRPHRLYLQVKGNFPIFSVLWLTEYYDFLFIPIICFTFLDLVYLYSRETFVPPANAIYTLS
jgi:hypothetical protein